MIPTRANFQWGLCGLCTYQLHAPGYPPPPPGRWGFDQLGRGQMYPKSPSGDRRNGQTAPPCTRGYHSADWRQSMCPTAVTHFVVKFPTPGQSEAVKSPAVSRGGGGLAIDRCITSWYPNFNGSHFGLPPSSIHRITGLGGKFV